MEGTRKVRPSLAEVSRLAGSDLQDSQLLHDCVWNGDSRRIMLYVFPVRQVYRVARQLMFSEREGDAKRASKGMKAFAGSMEASAWAFEEVGDEYARLLCLHSCGTGWGMSGNKQLQVEINWSVFWQLEGLVPQDDEEKFDHEHVQHKVVACLLENDEDTFRQESHWGLLEFAGYVDRLFELRASDAPGRALWLAKYLLEDCTEESREDARRLLVLASSDVVRQFGKVDQIHDVEQFYQEQFGEVPAEEVNSSDSASQLSPEQLGHGVGALLSTPVPHDSDSSDAADPPSQKSGGYINRGAGDACPTCEEGMLLAHDGGLRCIDDGCNVYFHRMRVTS